MISVMIKTWLSYTRSCIFTMTVDYKKINHKVQQY